MTANTNNYSGVNEKKFLDYEGVKHLWSKISMEDYPNNQTLMSVIEAIDETKADKNQLIEIGIVIDELIGEKIYKQDEEPKGVPEGTLWLDTDEAPFLLDIKSYIEEVILGGEW